MHKRKCRICSIGNKCVTKQLKRALEEPKTESTYVNLNDQQEELQERIGEIEPETAKLEQ